MTVSLVDGSVSTEGRDTGLGVALEVVLQLVHGNGLWGRCCFARGLASVVPMAVLHLLYVRGLGLGRD